MKYFLFLFFINIIKSVMLKYQSLTCCHPRLPHSVYRRSSVSAMINYFELLPFFILINFIFIWIILINLLSIHICSSICHICLFVLKIVILVSLSMLWRLLHVLPSTLNIATLFIHIFGNLFCIFIIVFEF